MTGGEQTLRETAQSGPGGVTDGFIVLWKPAGISSARAVYRVRSITGVRKSGHAGALDPGAEGILIVCQGKATRLVERFMGLAKVYRAVVRLDVTSESLDGDSPLIPVPAAREPGEDAVLRALEGFVGTIDQLPPRISAVKIGGVPSYKRARRGESFVPRSRPVRIDWIRLERYSWPTVEIEMSCGRGTYVRSVARDVGQVLGTGGCLMKLVRTAIGPFTEAGSWTLEGLQSAGCGADFLVSMDHLEDRLGSVGGG